MPREEVRYTIDATKSPKPLDSTKTEGAAKPILETYEVKGDEPKVCVRHQPSREGRPTEFVTKEDSDLLLIVSHKQKP